jgi:hypothetical protein
MFSIFFFLNHKLSITWNICIYILKPNEYFINDKIQSSYNEWTQNKQNNNFLNNGVLWNMIFNYIQ